MVFRQNDLDGDTTFELIKNNIKDLLLKIDNSYKV